MLDAMLSYSIEAAAFGDALDRCAPNAVTACSAWTAHELLAHVVAGGLELGLVAGSYLTGEPTAPTRSFEEREAPFRALDDTALRDLFAGAGGQLGETLTAIHGRDPAATIAFTA